MNKNEGVVIRPVTVDGIEFLPLEHETPLFTKPDYIGMSDAELRNIFLYRAIAERENHYQVNTPPVWGDPKYSRLDGYMVGLIQGYGLEIDETGEAIVVKTKKGRVIMTVYKPKLPESYSEVARENYRLLRELGL